MGEPEENVFKVGCPSGDIALNFNSKLSPDIFEKGVGGHIDIEKPYLLVVFHPVTTEYGLEKDETSQLLHALNEIKMQTVFLWPNIDAGSDHVSKTIRSFRENNSVDWLRLIKNYPPEQYLKVLANAVCAVGNSSSFVRDASFLGTPVVLVGDRQQGREIAENVTPVPPLKQPILDSIHKQLKHGRYSASHLYGDGKSSERIAKKLLAIKPFVQKKLNYK
jgi:UDP-hydrolysing UDP-N-acetyl-D-glucosamine 2-epimerase